MPVSLILWEKTTPFGLHVKRQLPRSYTIIKMYVFPPGFFPIVAKTHPTRSTDDDRKIRLETVKSPAWMLQLQGCGDEHVLSRLVVWTLVPPQKIVCFSLLNRSSCILFTHVNTWCLILEITVKSPLLMGLFVWLVFCWTIRDFEFLGQLTCFFFRHVFAKLPPQ